MHFNTITSTIALLAATVAGAPTLEENMSLIDLARRQTSNPCSQWTPQTRIVGDGSPKDKVLWKQVTVSYDHNIFLLLRLCSKRY